MSGLEQVKRAIVEALEAEGTAALAAFPPARAGAARWAATWGSG